MGAVVWRHLGKFSACFACNIFIAPLFKNIFIRHCIVFYWLTENEIGPKVFTDLTEEDITSPEIGLSFGGKKVVRGILKVHHVGEKCRAERISNSGKGTRWCMYFLKSMEQYCHLIPLHAWHPMQPAPNNTLSIKYSIGYQTTESVEKLDTTQPTTSKY